MFVFVSEPRKADRVDRQLIGRCARQGDPEKAVVFASAEDDLFEAAEYSSWGQMKSNGDWDAKKISRKIRDLQSTFYEKAYQSRQSLLKHDDWREGLLKKLS